MTPSGSSFTHRVTVRWADTDAYGHVSHPVYLTYLEEARERFLARALGPDPMYVVARVELDYTRPLTFGDIHHREAVVDVAIERVGTTSIVLRESVRDGSGTEVARSLTTIVCWSPAGGVSRALTAAERAALASL